MDVLVNASDPEPFGIVILEGMARGVAVVAVDSGGPPEFIDDQRHRRARTVRRARRARRCDRAAASLQRAAGADRAGRAAPSFMEEYTTAAMRRRFFASLQRRYSACEMSMPDASGTTVATTPVDSEEQHVAGASEDAARDHDRRARHRAGGRHGAAALGAGRSDCAQLGHRVTVIARTCELPRGHGRRLPPRPRARSSVRARLSVVHARRARWRCAGGAAGVVQATGAIVAQPRRRRRDPLLPPGRPRQPEPLDAAVPRSREARPAMLKRRRRTRCACAQPAPRRSCASPRASRRRCASTSPRSRAASSRSTTASTRGRSRPGARAPRRARLRARARDRPSGRSSPRSSAASGSARASSP